MTETIIAWHFSGATLRDGRPIPHVGEWLRHDGDVVICKSGFHASERALDALQYAPGVMLHRVELRGDIARQDDKLAARERRVLWSADAEKTLRDFARSQALGVIHLWSAPAIVRQYLETGDEKLRAAAQTAAQTAARDASAAAAWAAAEAAAEAAPWAAAWGAARSAAWDAAWDVARAVANDDLTARLMALAPATVAPETKEDLG